MRTTDPRAGGFNSYIDSLRQGLAGSQTALEVEGVFSGEQRARVLSLRAPPRFWRRVRSELASAELLHVHGIFGWHVLLGVLAAWRTQRPYVLSLHGHLQPAALRERALSKRLILALIGRRILTRAAAVLVTAPAEAECLRAQAPAAKVRELVPGLPVPEHAPPPANDSPTLRVLYIGRLHPHKGLPLLLDALAQVRAEGLDASLAVAGGGHAHHRRQALRHIAELGLDEAVTLVGHIDAAERDRRLANCDVLALPSRSENFGFVVAEAMAAARPVIVSEGVGLAPTVRAWDCGTVIPVGDAQALATALRTMTNPEVRARQGAQALAAARARFALTKMGTQAETIYREAIGPSQTTAAETP